MHSRAAVRLPATMIGKSGLRDASIRALCRMQDVFPPSVPPASRKISGFWARMASRSSSVSSKENWPMSFAPAPRLAIRAASSVSSGTRPEAIIRRPPAAEEQA